jgi:hypothetical protein
LAQALEAYECVQGSEEVARNGGVVAEIGLPLFGRHRQEAYADRFVRVQGFGAVWDPLAGATTLRGGADVEHAGLDLPRAETPPVRLSETQNERMFGATVRLERLDEAPEDFVVFMQVFLGEDDKGGRGEAMLEGVEAAALLAGFGFGAATAPVAAVGFTLAF